ncbi:HPr family phosphocarrier protein [Gallaecimonas sp. GXIMD4217]|uniref:HPr family phosphocarrier protein n=1 Tax=Gallaecimonas sp. GXIMD4217 TaxID=3131927 RepID=UPI00311AD56D
MRHSRTLILKNRLGLHARAATALVQLCHQFRAEIRLEANGRQADANSVLALLLLEGSQGLPVTVHCSGDQAHEALEAVCGLIDAGFDED